MDFTVKKFKASLSASTFTLIVQYIMMLSDNLIIGNLIGNQAIAGMSLISPIATFLTFICLINTLGSSVCRSRELGNFNKEKADEFYSQGVILSFLSGMIFFVAMRLGLNGYISFIGASEAVSAYAREYLRFYVFILLISSYNMFLANIILAEGDALICNISFGIQIVGNILFSLILTMKIGVAGASLGSLITMILNIGVLSLHFLRKDNQLKFKWHLKLKDTMEVVRMSFAGSFCRVLWAIQFVIFNKFAVNVYGDEYLPIISVLTNLIQFSNIFQGIGIALRPFIRIYMAERNSMGMNRLMKASDKLVLIEGALLTGFMMIFAGPITRFFGITDPSIAGTCKSCIFILAFSMIFHACEFTYATYYLTIERFGLCWGVTLMEQLAAPIFALVFAKAFESRGVRGLCTGLSLGAFLAIAIFVIWVILAHGKRRFPLMIEHERSDKQFMDTIFLDKVSLMDSIGKVNGFLHDMDVPSLVINRMEVIAEETGISIYENNPGKKVLFEIFIDANDGYNLFIRDDGKLFDITNTENELNSFHDFIYSSIMEHHRMRHYIANVGYNRNSFEFNE